ncbi:MAG: signal peptidase II [Actinobacteria bacterium]|nr:signal peptidase II [Actinomycetota bacterium]
MRGLQERGAHLTPLITAAVAVGVVAVDQVTKSLVLDRLGNEPVHLFWTLRLNLSFNRGVAFSQGQGLGPLITVAALLLVVVLVVMSRSTQGKLPAAALGLLIGGACGNLGDRLFRDHGGAVIDFIDLQWWPIFNVADMAITTGAALLLLTGLRQSPGHPGAARTEPD